VDREKGTAQVTPTSLGSDFKTSELSSLAAVSVGSPDEIHRVLGDETALVSFFVSDDSTTIVTLQDGQLSLFVRQVGRGTLEDKVRELRQALENDRMDIARFHRLSKQLYLYSDLLGKAMDHITKRVIYLVPHGPLHYVPFAALFDGSRYLVERFTLIATPSATVLTYLEKKSRSHKVKPIVFANPDLNNPEFDLPFAEQEGHTIKALYPNGALLSRKSAQEASVYEQATQNDILHFASHAIFSPAHPLDSAVLLSPGRGQDGKLTAREVFGLPLPGTLVVLSGCETGLGKVIAGDEILGLIPFLIR
jgi:CHAT domain-containing protein